MDFGALPPEVNSGRMYCGPGSAPMVAAASAWNGLAAELSVAAVGYERVITTLQTEEWLGPASTLMVEAVAPYVAWMRATAIQAEQAASQARAAAAAYETAFAAIVPPPLIAANRARLTSLVTHNVFGQNTASIAATEAQYAEMWAQDAMAMYGYAGSSATATKVTPFAPPPNTTSHPPRRRSLSAVANSTPVRRPARTPPGSSSGSAPPVLISRWNAVTSLMPQRPTEWWRWPPPRACRCAACCTRRRWSRTLRWPMSPTNLSTAVGRRRYTARGTFIGPPPRSHWSGSACSPRPRPWWARRVKAHMRRHSWLDAFAHWRRAQGLPATSIAWGAWAEIGRATALAEGTGAAIAPAEGARAFQTLLRYGRAYSGYAPIMGTPWLTAFAQRSRFAEAFHATGQNQPATGKFLAELGSLPREEWPRTVRRLVSDQISLLLRRTIDPDRPLSDYGLDSLGNLELRTRIETETGIRVSPTKITTVRGLAEHVCDELAAAQSAPV